MAVTHINRREDTYFLHEGKTKTGKPKYWFSKGVKGDLVDEVPEGYEIYENPAAQVFLRKIVPQVITPFEVALVEQGLERYAAGQKCLVDLQGMHIVVYHAERTRLAERGFRFGLLELPEYHSNYTKVMRFTLVDEGERTFAVQRWCFRGSIDRWIDLWHSGGQGKLADQVKRFCPHIGQESFFELM
jgi:hypothetical protein